MISPIFWDFWPLHPHCHPVGLWSNVTFWRIPLPLSWWCHLWMTPTPILMITFLSLFEGIINSEVKYDNLNMHCHSGTIIHQCHSSLNISRFSLSACALRIKITISNFSRQIFSEEKIYYLPQTKQSLCQLFPKACFSSAK